MTEKDLDTRFTEAVEAASKMTKSSLPPDMQLRLYAFYKQATFGTAVYNNSNSFDLRDAFKTNAWLQISHYTIDEAKTAYVAIVKAILKKE